MYLGGCGGVGWGCGEGVGYSIDLCLSSMQNISYCTIYTQISQFFLPLRGDTRWMHDHHDSNDGQS